MLVGRDLGCAIERVRRRRLIPHVAAEIGEGRVQFGGAVIHRCGPFHRRTRGHKIARLAVEMPGQEVPEGMVGGLCAARLHLPKSSVEIALQRKYFGLPLVHQRLFRVGLERRAVARKRRVKPPRPRLEQRAETVRQRAGDKTGITLDPGAKRVNLRP